MRVAFLYNRSSEDPANAAEDEVPAQSPVVGALKRLGHKVTPIACTLDLAKVRRQMLRAKPDVAFNRVDSLGGSDAMMAAVTMLLDAMRIPYTGNSSAAITATASKILAKERLVKAGLPTPRWIMADCGLLRSINPKSEIRIPKFILKSVYEHASYEMDDSSVVCPTSSEQLRDALCDRESATGRAHFAEEFIDGREFNLSLLGEAPEVLPPAEIDFSTFSPDIERIVGCRAKCDEESFEYLNTERLYDFPASDRPLLGKLSELSVECWRLFDLRGYARVDFRVDAAGQPWILEINPNPCFLPDAGFTAAVEQAGISYEGAVERILNVASRGTTNAISQPGKRRAALKG